MQFVTIVKGEFAQGASIRHVGMYKQPIHCDAASLWELTAVLSEEQEGYETTFDKLYRLVTDMESEMHICALFLTDVKVRKLLAVVR